MVVKFNEGCSCEGHAVLECPSTPTVISRVRRIEARLPVLGFEARDKSWELGQEKLALRRTRLALSVMPGCATRSSSGQSMVGLVVGYDLGVRRPDGLNAICRAPNDTTEAR